MMDGIDSIKIEAYEIAEQYREIEFHCPDHASSRLVKDGLRYWRCPVDYAVFTIDGLGLVRREM